MPCFLRQQVDPSRPDGYWLESFPYEISQCNKTPHLIAYGLGTLKEDGKIILYLNPYNPSTPAPAIKDAAWQKREIGVLPFPVACNYADVTGNGFNDVFVSDGYGPSLKDIWADGGRVSWFENNGDLNDTKHWKRRYVGKSPGMHRLKAGHFTRTDKVQIAAFPIVIKSLDFTSPAPVIVYTSPDDPTSLPVDDDSQGWPQDVPFPDTFRLVHEAVLFKRENHLDQLVLAGKDGISVIWFDTSTNNWKSENIGVGLPPTPGNEFWGSGSVAVAKVRDDQAGYVASSEAFHGNVVAVYIKPASSPKNTLSGIDWKRVVLDDFGSLNSEHTGSIHQVTCGDIDGDGIDETLVATIGTDPPSWKQTGVWCYKPIDLEKGNFIKLRLSDESAARIGFGDFTDRGLVEYATISYCVPGYFESPNPSVNIYASSPITAHKLNEEVLFLIPDPSQTLLVDEVEFLDVSGKKLSLVVLPPGQKFRVENDGGVKVIFGKLTWVDTKGDLQSRTQATDPFTTVSNIVCSEDGFVQAGIEGAAFTLLKVSSTSGHPPYTDISQLVAHNIFPPRFPEDVKNMKFTWVKVEDRPWANGRFKGLEFYNLTGFHVKLASDSLQHICHFQLWTAGVGVNCGFHNHTGDTFCEIHTCIVNGTGKGGMSWATVADDQFDPNNPDPAKCESIIVNDMHDLGPLWRTAQDGLPSFRKNSSVDYSWHAWIAGSDATQSFDVWIVYEFPPLTALSLRGSATSPAPGLYELRHTCRLAAAAVKNGDSVDGAPVIGEPVDPSTAAQQWRLENITGTDAMSIKNVKSGSFATSNWPPIAGQHLVGSRSLAVLGITSNWVLTTHGQDVKISLIGTNLVWALNGDNRVVLEKERVDEGQNWRLVSLSVN